MEEEWILDLKKIYDIYQMIKTQIVKKGELNLNQSKNIKIQKNTKD
jgi:hypothetical protein